VAIVQRAHAVGGLAGSAEGVIGRKLFEALAPGEKVGFRVRKRPGEAAVRLHDLVNDAGVY
jgi:hypothetical protein